MEKIKKFWNEASVVKKIAICVAFILFALLAAGFGGPSACDCANIRDSSPMSKDYSPSQLDDADFQRREVDNYISKQKACAQKYGKLTEMEKELARTATESMWIPGLDQAIDNAKAECEKK
jgi:hypothetical protein